MKKRSKAKVKRSWTSPGMEPQEDEEHTEPYLKLGSGTGRWRPWGTRSWGPSCEQECSWSVRRTRQELVCMLWVRKAEGTWRWAQGLLKLCAKVYLLSQRKTSGWQKSCSTDLALPVHRPWAARAAAPQPKSHRDRVCTADEPLEGAGRPPRPALPGSMLWENRVQRGRRGRLFPSGRARDQRTKNWMSSLCPLQLKGTWKGFNLVISLISPLLPPSCCSSEESSSTVYWLCDKRLSWRDPKKGKVWKVFSPFIISLNNVQENTRERLCWREIL